MSVTFPLQSLFVLSVIFKELWLWVANGYYQSIEFSLKRDSAGLDSDT